MADAIFAYVCGSASLTSRHHRQLDRVWSPTEKGAFSALEQRFMAHILNTHHRHRFYATLAPTRPPSRRFSFRAPDYPRAEGSQRRRYTKG